MMTGTAIVTLIATLGWLALNFRALQAHGLSTRQKVTMAFVWLILFASVAALLESLGR